MKYFKFTPILVFFSACSILEGNSNLKTTVDESLPKSNINKFDILDSECQQTKFSQNDTLRLTGDEGTQIIIYPKSFNSTDDTLRVFLKECYKLSDLLQYNLQTITETREILQTKGMIYLKVLNSDGNEVMINNNMSIHVIFAATNVDSEYMLFDGKIENNSMTWTNPSRRIDKFSPVFFSSPKEGEDGYELYKKDRMLYIEYLSKRKSGATNFELNIFEIRSLGWKNLDKLFINKNFVTFRIEIQEKFENGRLYCLYPDDKILIEFKNVNNNFISDRIIANKKHTLLFIGEISGDMYYQLVKDSISSQNKFLKFNQFIRCESIKDIVDSQISWI